MLTPGSSSKFVVSPCQSAQVILYYGLFPRSLANHGDEGRMYRAYTTTTVGALLTPSPNLDKGILDLLKISADIRPWRLFVRQPCKCLVICQCNFANIEPDSYWTKGVACVMGYAAHPTMLDQSQGACQAIEDSTALGLVFNKQDFKDHIKALEVYESRELYV